MLVRVEDMRGVDLARWRFDWDLTFAIVAARADGTILHRYGGRDARGANRWLNLPSLKAFLRAGLRAHAEQAGPSTPLDKPIRLEALPSFALRDKGACIHCHSVNPALRLEAQAAGTWSRNDLWTYPAPAQVGLDVDPQQQSLVTAVKSGSVAASAGVRIGDRLVRLGDTDLATASDLMAALDGLPSGASKAPLHVARDPQSGSEPETQELLLDLPNGWRVASPREFAWRPSKWGLSPAPGFGGPVLDAGELRAIGLAPGTFAFRVSYLVTWGENKRWGQRAAKAGITKGQVVLGAGDKRDFASADHFHAWWRLTRQAGRSVEVHLWEAGQVRSVTLSIGD